MANSPPHSSGVRRYIHAMRENGADGKNGTLSGGDSRGDVGAKGKKKRHNLPVVYPINKTTFENLP